MEVCLQYQSYLQSKTWFSLSASITVPLYFLDVQEYQGAADAFMEALRLDPESDEIKRALG
jgi:hypothetical protein